jgi:hypothetical protein
MEPVGPTYCETRWRAVLASFDKQYETLIANNPDATEEINLFLDRAHKNRAAYSDLSAAK